MLTLLFLEWIFSYISTSHDIGVSKGLFWQPQLNKYPLKFSKASTQVFKGIHICAYTQSVTLLQSGQLFWCPMCFCLVISHHQHMEYQHLSFTFDFPQMLLLFKNPNSPLNKHFDHKFMLDVLQKILKMDVTWMQPHYTWNIHIIK